jgi:hypothetical protein
MMNLDLLLDTEDGGSSETSGILLTTWPYNPENRNPGLPAATSRSGRCVGRAAVSGALNNGRCAEN